MFPITSDVVFKRVSIRCVSTVTRGTDAKIYKQNTSLSKDTEINQTYAQRYNISLFQFEFQRP